MFRFVAFLLVVCIFFPSDPDADSPRVKNLPRPNTASVLGEEEYVYEVSWTFFKLGTIRIRSFGNFEGKAYIDSYEGLPFVDLHSVYFTRMDSAFFSLGASSMDKSKNHWAGLEYRYVDSSSSVIVMETVHATPSSPPTRRSVRDTIRLAEGVFVDGLSIGFYPRALVHSKQTIRLPTILKGKLGETTFRFTGRSTYETIPVIADPVRVVEVAGTTNAEGIFGMTGDFKGWFSDDAQAVPIKGKLKVLLGNVTIDLIEWNRKGWHPPIE